MAGHFDDTAVGGEVTLEDYNPTCRLNGIAQGVNDLLQWCFLSAGRSSSTSTT